MDWGKAPTPGGARGKALSLGVKVLGRGQSPDSWGGGKARGKALTPGLDVSKALSLWEAWGIDLSLGVKAWKAWG